MAALVIDSADVVAQPGAILESGTAGVAIEAGEVIYQRTSDSRYGLADADSADAEKQVVRGIALHSAAAGQPLRILRDGDVDLGEVLSPGIVYVAGAAGGALHPAADLASGWKTSVVGVALSTSRLRVRIINSAAAVA